MKKRGSLFVVSGPSGVGKGTIINELFRTTDDLFYSISVTSRLPREGEREGVNYFFVNQDKFKLMIEADEFL
ncbi:MAG: guanylate kinase, partial [bacterium]